MKPNQWTDPRATRSDGNEPALGFKVALGALARYWSFVRPYQGKFFLGIALMLLAVPLSQFALFLTRDVTNKALLATSLTVDERWGTVLRIVGLQALFWLVSNILSTWREVLEWYNSMRVTFDVRLKYYRHLHSLPMQFLSKRAPGEHLFRATADMVSMFRIGNRAATATASGQSPPDSKEVVFSAYSNDVDPYDPGLAGLITRTVPLLVETLYTLAWGVTLLFLIDPMLSVALVAYIVPFALVSHFLFNRIRKTAFAVKRRTEFETGVLRDSIAGLRTLKAFGRLAFQKKKFLRAVSMTRRRGIQQAFEIALSQNVVQMGMKWAFSMSIYVYVAFRVVAGQATLGDWVATFLLVEAAQAPLENFVQLIQLTKMQLVPAQRVLETLDVRPSLQDKPGATNLEPFTGRFEFRDVRLSYSNERTALNGLDLKIEPGEYIGVVGPSGAGKSSLIALMLRLYAADSGSVLVDGQSVLDIKLQSLLDQTGTVPQDTTLFSGTIADNILFGNPSASHEELVKAAKDSGVLEFIDRWADGLDTEVTESGFSGGERQRIGIARALIRNPKLLVLDEATASLDPASEDSVLQIVEGLRHGRTIVSIAHRLKAVTNCDRIVVLDSGRVAQTGRHEDLVKTAGPYQDLWKRQQPEEAAGANT